MCGWGSLGFRREWEGSWGKHKERVNKYGYPLFTQDCKVLWIDILHGIGLFRCGTFSITDHFPHSLPHVCHHLWIGDTYYHFLSTCTLQPLLLLLTDKLIMHRLRSLPLTYPLWLCTLCNSIFSHIHKPSLNATFASHSLQLLTYM